MHNEILNSQQKELLPLIKQFSSDYYLVGGTAIALQIGHRSSIDFDLFSNSGIKRKRIRNILEKSKFPMGEVIYEAFDQLHIIVNSVKLTFFAFEYDVPTSLWLDNVIQMPTLLDLAAMKAYALGGRAKWKDYVDLYFLLKDHFHLANVSTRAKEIFGSFFNEKLFREQLSYFHDIDYSEKVAYFNQSVSDETVKKFLEEIALTPF